MKKKISIILISTIITVLFTSANDKPPKIKIWCLEKNLNEFMYRIENAEKVAFYLPEEFKARYSKTLDTIYFEALYDEGSTKKSYHYYSSFGKTVSTSEAIEGLMADSVNEHRTAIRINEFAVPKLIPLKPDSFIVGSRKIQIPKKLKYAVFHLYRSGIDSKMDYEVFRKFDKKESLNVICKIYEVVEE